MNLQFKNGKNIFLEWNPIILEYIDGYVGGVSKLKEDIKNKTNLIYIANHLAYSVIAANLENSLNFKEVMKLITPDDVENIIDFIISNSNSVNNNNLNFLRH